MRLGGRYWRGALAAVAAVTVLGVVAVPAFAASYFTGWKSFNNARSYENREAITLFDDGSGVTSRGYLHYISGSGTPHCEIQTYVYNRAGNTMASGSAWFYASVGDTWSVVTSDKSTAHGNYHAQGWTGVPATGGGTVYIPTYETSEYAY